MSKITIISESTDDSSQPSASQLAAWAEEEYAEAEVDNMLEDETPTTIFKDQSMD